MNRISRYAFSLFAILYAIVVTPIAFVFRPLLKTRNRNADVHKLRYWMVLVAFVFVLTSANSVNADLTTSIADYWTFDLSNYSSGEYLNEIAAREFYNASSSSNTGLIGQSVDFDGTSDYVLVHDDFSHVFGNNDWSLSFWYYADTASGLQSILDYSPNSTATEWVRFNLDWNNNWKQSAWDDGSTLRFIRDSAAPPSTGEWVHVVWVHDESVGYEVFINNASVGTTGDNGDLVNINSALRLGVYSGDWFDGRVDELGIWTRTLNSTEIGELYNSGSGLQYPFSPAPPANTSLVELTAVDAYDDTALTNFSVEAWRLPSGYGIGAHSSGWVQPERSFDGDLTTYTEIRHGSGSPGNMGIWSLAGSGGVVGEDTTRITDGAGTVDVNTTGCVEVRLKMYANLSGYWECSLVPGRQTALRNMAGLVYEIRGLTGNFSTTNGTIVTNINDTTPNRFNFTYSSSENGGYFDNASRNINVSSGSYEASLAQAYVSFTCSELYTNDSLSCDESGPFPRKAGSYTDQINVTGYHPVNYSYTLSALDNLTFNVTGFYDHKLNVTAEDYTGSPLSNFTIFYNSSTLNGSESDNDTGWVLLELFQNDTYTIEIVENIPSGAERNNSIESTVITVPESSPPTTQFYQFNLSYPSLTITVLDEDTGVLVPGNTTLTFVEGNSSFEKTVVNGSAVFNASNSLPSGTYDIQFENEDYSDRTYSLTYNRTYPQSLTAYLVNTSSPSVVFILEDRETRNVIEGATITVQRFVNGSLTTVNVLTSDITGRTSFDYLTDEQYRFQITHADYTSRNFTLDPILFSSYTILLDSPTSVGETEGDYSGIGYVFTSTTFTEQETNSLNATISDASGSLVEYGFNVTVDGVQLTSQTGTNAYGSVLTSSFAIPAVGYNESLILDYWYMKSDGIMHEFRASYSIEQVTAYSNQTWAGNRDIAESIPILDRALVVVLILLAVGALAYTFAGLVGSGVAVMMIMGFFSYTGFINPWVFAVPIIGLFFLIIGRSSA